MSRALVSVLALCLSACAAPAPLALLDSSELASRSPHAAAASAQGPFEVQRSTRPLWRPGQPLMHGFLGVTEFEHVEVEDSGGGHVDGDRGDLDELPLIGGGAQWKSGGDKIDYGFEGLLSFGWQSDAEAFVIGGGGAAIAIDVDLLLFELYGGPFVSTFVGDKLRLYGAVGPLMQFADYAQSGGGLGDDGSGFGFGWYARTGFEFMLPGRTLIGLGARWSDTTVDLDGGLGDLEMEGVQGMFTVSRGI